jgi:hypothetical protein
MGRHRLDRSGSGQGQVADGCKCGNELSGSVKYGDLPDLLASKVGLYSMELNSSAHPADVPHSVVFEHSFKARFSYYNKECLRTVSVG